MVSKDTETHVCGCRKVFYRLVKLFPTAPILTKPENTSMEIEIKDKKRRYIDELTLEKDAYTNLNYFLITVRKKDN